VHSRHRRLWNSTARYRRTFVKLRCFRLWLLHSSEATACVPLAEKKMATRYR
jgi:hypothetical protein